MHTAAASIAVFVQSQQDTQKRNEWGKRLGDIVGLKLLADYQSAVQVQTWWLICAPLPCCNLGLMLYLRSKSIVIEQ